MSSGELEHLLVSRYYFKIAHALCRTWCSSCPWLYYVLLVVVPACGLSENTDHWWACWSCFVPLWPGTRLRGSQPPESRAWVLCASFLGVTIATKASRSPVTWSSMCAHTRERSLTNASSVGVVLSPLVCSSPTRRHTQVTLCRNYDFSSFHGTTLLI